MANPQHVTLVAATVATVTLDRGASRVEVLNVDGAAAVYFSLDRTEPTVAGNGFHVLPAAIGSLEVSPAGAGDSISVIKLISSGTPKVSVRTIP